MEMIELIQSSFDKNTPLLFTVALFFAAISGQKLKVSHRVALVYSFCLLMGYFDIVDFYVNGVGSLIVLFLVFEVFSSDNDLVHLYSFKYKTLDYLFRLLVEYYGWLFYLALFAAAYAPCKDSVIMQMVFAIATLQIASIVSRHRLATKDVSAIIARLRELGGDPASCSFSAEEINKLKLLVFMEDGSYFSRDEKVHIITLRCLLKKLFARVGKWKGNIARGCTRRLRRLKRHIRGFGTIEMQILRNVGLDFGSYQLSIRRKVFELLFSQALFNCYIDQLSENSFARKNFKYWLLNCYLCLVPVKVGKTVCKPIGHVSTFKKLFKKDFSEVSMEEFFVWCLGLPHYANGVGENAVMIHKDAVRKFNLDERKNREAISRAREQCP